MTVTVVSVVCKKVTSTGATTAYSYMTEFLSYHIFDVTLYVCMFNVHAVCNCMYIL